jgi:hypothetical protein
MKVLETYGPRRKGTLEDHLKDGLTGRDFEFIWLNLLSPVDVCAETEHLAGVSTSFVSMK